MLNAGTSIDFQIAGGRRCLQVVLSANSVPESEKNTFPTG